MNKIKVILVLLSVFFVFLIFACSSSAIEYTTYSNLISTNTYTEILFNYYWQSAFIKVDPEFYLYRSNEYEYTLVVLDYGATTSIEEESPAFSVYILNYTSSYGSADYIINHDVISVDDFYSNFSPSHFYLCGSSGLDSYSLYCDKYVDYYYSYLIKCSLPFLCVVVLFSVFRPRFNPVRKVIN